MGSLTSLYDLSRNSLLADQAALSVVANNVANQNTAGYTKEVATFQAGDSVTFSNGALTVTEAPTVTTTSQRNRVLDQRVQQQTQVQSASAARADALSQIEGVFNLSGSSTTTGSTEIGTALDGLFSSFTTLTSDASDDATRQGVLSAAGTLATAFKSAASQLTGIQSSLSGGLTSSVTAVNSLTAQIAQLNTTIAEQSPNSDAGTLEDQRQQAIAQLSTYIGLDQITTENNGVDLTTASGITLVSGGTAGQLSSVNVGGTIQVRDSSGTDVSALITGGSIGGQLTAQNVDLPEVSSALDTLAYNVAKAVNTQNEAGLDGTGAAGGAIFAVTSTAAGAAAAISVTATDPSAVAAAGAGEGVTGNTNAQALQALATQTDRTGNTFASSLAGLLSQVGTTSAAVWNDSTTQQTTLTNLTTQLNSYSGVSLDEEASNLSLYQESYNAAAKLFSIVDSVMVAALNLGEQTTVS